MTSSSSPSTPQQQAAGQGGGGDGNEVARLRAEVERLKAGKVRRGEQLRRLMAELKAVRAGRAGAESAFEHLNEAVAGLRREEERRADQAVAERDRARADLEAQRAAAAAAEARAAEETRRAEAAEARAAEAEALLARREKEREAAVAKLSDEQQRADRVLLHNLQLANRVRQLEEGLQSGGEGVSMRDVEGGGADGATSRGGGGLVERAWAVWNQRDRKGVMVITVLSLVLFWYLTTVYSGG